MKRYLLLKAVKYNWGLKAPDDWETVTWLIYNNLNYQIQIVSNSTVGFISDELIDHLFSLESNKHTQEKDVQITKGKMIKSDFQKLKTLLDSHIWRDPVLVIDACDGEAWEIEYYSPEGELINSSGPADYIYGQEILESIANLLPSAGEEY